MSKIKVTLIIDDETGEREVEVDGNVLWKVDDTIPDIYVLTVQLPRDTDRSPELPPAENIGEALQNFASTLVVLPEGTKVIDGDDKTFVDEDDIHEAKTQTNASPAPLPEPEDAVEAAAANFVEQLGHEPETDEEEEAQLLAMVATLPLEQGKALLDAGLESDVTGQPFTRDQLGLPPLAVPQNPIIEEMPEIAVPINEGGGPVETYGDVEILLDEPLVPASEPKVVGDTEDPAAYYVGEGKYAPGTLRAPSEVLEELKHGNDAAITEEGSDGQGE